MFIWLHGAGEGDWFYGFPREAGGVKLATEQFVTRTPGPEAWDRTSSREEALAQYARHAEGRLQGLAPNWRSSAACVYTLAPDSRFIVDRDPMRDKVVVISACSGHGFKFGPLIGQRLTEAMILDKAEPLTAWAAGKM